MSINEWSVSRRQLVTLLGASAGAVALPACSQKAEHIAPTPSPSAQSLPAESPLATATHRWDMSSDSAKDFTVHGAVTLGVSLEGADQSASFARGGDGKAAKFEGGYLALANDTGFAVNPNQWTIAIRMRDPQGTWRYPILGSYGSDKTVSVTIRAVDIASKPMEDRHYRGGLVPTVESWFVASDGPRSVPGATLLEAVWGAKVPDAARVQRIRDLQPASTKPNPLEQDVANGVMRVNFPIGLIGPNDWHDIVLAMTGAKLELWIDGVLVDEFARTSDPLIYAVSLAPVSDRSGPRKW